MSTSGYINSVEYIFNYLIYISLSFLYKFAKIFASIINLEQFFNENIYRRLFFFIIFQYSTLFIY